MSQTLQEHIREKAARQPGREPTGRATGRNRGKSKAIQVSSTEQRRAEVWKLRLECRLTERAIAERVGVSPAVVHDDLVAVARRNIQSANESWATHRQLSLERLERGIEMALDGATDLEADTKDRVSWLDQYRKFVVEEAKLRGLFIKGAVDDSKEDERLDDDSMARIVLMLAQPDEQFEQLLTKAVCMPGSTLLAVLKRIQHTMPIDTTAESVE